MSLFSHPLASLATFCSVALIATFGLAVAPNVDVPSVLHLRPEDAACPDRPVDKVSDVDLPRAVARHVVLISVDGLRPDAITALGASGAPAFYQLRRGAITDNARTDFAKTSTLPNHMSQLTGRAVLGNCGHNWTDNGLPAEGATLHTNKGSYVASVFDVVGDHGLRTVAFASKSKFSLLEASYELDTLVLDSDTDALTDAFVAELQATRPGFALLHLRDPDGKGHHSGWDVSPESPYMRSVQRVDSLLGSVIGAIRADSLLDGRTTVILTADHGGVGGHIREGHYHPHMRANYTIPFYVWGAGVGRGANLYALNRETRRDPGRGRPSYRAARQPIRNGDAANLALTLLGLPGVPGSHINQASVSLIVSGHTYRLAGGGEAVEG